jgi:hypothetical protein
VGSFNHDYDRENMLVGAEIIDFPFWDSNIGVSEDLLRVEERGEIQIVLIKI